MRRNGLNQYDAPLRIQYECGYEAFKKGGRFVTVRGSKMFLESRPNLHPNSMQAREWQRGWNDAYYDNLEKGKYNGIKGRC